MFAEANSFRGFQAFGNFLFFGAAMAVLGRATLIWRSPFLGRLWALNAQAYHRLAPFGSAAGVAFLVLGAVLVMAGRGWFLRRFWGWGLVAVLVATQTVGSVVNAILGDFWKGQQGQFLQARYSVFFSVRKCEPVSAGRLFQTIESGEPVSLRNRASSHEAFRLARLHARKMRAFQSAKVAKSTHEQHPQ